MDLNNLILFFVLIGFGIFFYKYFSLILKKYYPELLVDDQLGKPQAFHEIPISITGGAGIFFSLLIVYLNFFLFKDITLIFGLIMWPKSLLSATVNKITSLFFSAK